MTEHWDGISERRVNTALDTFTKALLDHTSDEMDRYGDILTRIDDNNEASIKRHDETHERISHLTQSIESFIHEQSEFITGMRRAFPKDDEGKPDYDGHRTAHLAWISDTKTTKDLKSYIAKVMMAAVAVAVSSFALVAMWSAFLKGPIQ